MLTHSTHPQPDFWASIVGHADFYPNGGSDHPCACKEHPSPDVDCEDWRNSNNHKGAPAYFEESIISSENFPDWKWRIGWDEFESERSCLFDTDSVVVPMQWGTGRIWKGKKTEYYICTQRSSHHFPVAGKNVLCLNVRNITLFCWSFKSIKNQNKKM